MKYPAFFDEVEKIKLKDELAEFLGAAEDGIYEIAYTEIVKMAGHSCATVAGAYLAALKGLKALFGEEIPLRGKIKVELRDQPEENNTGVTGYVLANITGAAENWGFGGVQGQYVRRGLLFFDADIESEIRLTRLDTGKSVEINYFPGKVVQPRKVLMSAIGPDADEESKKTFPHRWQEMVKTIIENADTVIEVKS